MSAERLKEFELIAWIRAQAGVSEMLRLGIGDDCAIQNPLPGADLLTTTDLLIEDVHFKRDWTSMNDLGHKAAAVNLSDIAAMGGQPVSLFLGLARPRDLSDQDLKDFLSGFLAETREAGAILAGGDTCASPTGLMISVTAQGQVPVGGAICRSGAAPGDTIYVSGPLGDSALALRQLQAGALVDVDLAARFHRPKPRIALGRMLSERALATAMLDLSDGLIADLGHILEASQVGAEIMLDKIPLSQPFREIYSTDPGLIDLALAGGEDYELVFTSGREDLEELSDLLPGVVRVGVICEERELRLRCQDGRQHYCQSGGFDHFD